MLKRIFPRYKTTPKITIPVIQKPPAPPMLPMQVDIALLARAQAVSNGANIHDLNQLICVYTLGINVFNRGLTMPTMPDYALSVRERSITAEQKLRTAVKELESQKCVTQLHALAEQNPRLAYFVQMLKQ